MAPSLQKLASDLQSAEPELREQAALQLAQAEDPQAALLLVRALGDPFEPVRVWAAYGLAALRREEDRPALLRSLTQDPAATVRLWAAFGMVNLGERAEATTLLSFLDEESLEVRDNAAEALLTLERPDWVRSALERRLASSQPRTRVWAAGVLHRMGHPDALEQWRKALSSPESRLDAAAVAHHLGEPGVARALLRTLCLLPRQELEAPVPSAGGLPAAEVLSAPLLELNLPALLEGAAQDRALRGELLLLLARSPSADPEVLGEVHQCLSRLEPAGLARELALLLPRHGTERAALLAGICGFFPELVVPTLEALEASVAGLLLSQVGSAISAGGEEEAAYAQLAEVLRASPFRSALEGLPAAASTLDEDPEVTSPGPLTLTEVEAPRPALTPADLPPEGLAAATQPPPSPAQAARRALCVAALLHRAALEQGTPSGAGAKVAAQDRELRSWLDREKLTAHLSPLELELLNERPFAWTDEQRSAVAWTQEALLVLLWALGKAKPPSPELTASSLRSSLPLLQGCAGFIGASKLVPGPALAAQREAWELWRWRARAEVSSRNEGDPLAQRAACTRAAARLCEQGLLDRTISGDFPFRGKAFHLIDERTLLEALAISQERHRTLHWLSLGGRWDEVAQERG